MQNPKNNSLLTAIIFTYNHKQSIARCIESLVFQRTCYTYEIHIWDDHSIDGTSDICRYYAAKYPEKIHLHIQPENTFLKEDLKLQSYAAISSIETPYFCVIDGDDYWCNENKIEIALDFLENNKNYIGFAHDTLLVDKYALTSRSYQSSLLDLAIKNPVTLSAGAPFFLTSSRVFRNCHYAKEKVLPIDYLIYYYHLSKGPIYYYDKIMAAYVVGENNTFANLGPEIVHLCAMFPYRISKLLNFLEDNFCTELLKEYDVRHKLNLFRLNYLKVLKRIFGVRWGWHLWFYTVFAWRYGLEAANINFVYSRQKAKEHSDRCSARDKAKAKR